MQPTSKRLVTEATVGEHVLTNLPANLQPAALDATYAPAAIARRAVYGPRWVFDGDSITINGISALYGNQDRSRTWTSELARLSMGRINYVYNAAVAGYRIDQLLARFDAFVAPQDPDVVLLTAGTNDIRQGRSMALWKADLLAYYEKVKAIGADLIVGAIWPSSDDSSAHAPTARTWNNELYAWAAANNVQVIPWDTLADPATGGWPAGWSSDLLHPTLLDSYAVIGKLGWQSVEPKVGPPVVRRAVTNGADALANGFFTTLTAVQAPPSLTAGTADTASGTLPAGTYSYKYTSRTFWGESLPSAERSVVLSATGKITVTNGTVSGSRGYNVYRKGPSDTAWKFITYLNSSVTTSFVDDGSIAAGTDMSGVDTSQYPTGLVSGSTTAHKIGPVTVTEAGIRGRIYRSMPLDGSAAAPNDYFPITVTAGETYDISCLIRSTGTTEGILIARFRNASSVAIGQVYVARDRMVNGWGLAAHRVTMPADTVTLRLSFEQTDSSSTGYAEFAEVRCQKV
ncbi:SGNH/GDSL hydrolase family protein [Pseudarthrobacter sp. CCNWLW207]|uniref:SGNH/GDSL hydrolase family protein n=1 Tax=Pseudarthrobacter sp. CCNWLW207 TaxID=3127468 RepID=UPI0030786C72